MSDQEITLTTPFPATKIKTKPGRGGSRPMTFISHGLITERLNQAAPKWTTERIATHTYTGQDGQLHCAGVEILMCIGEQCHAEAGGPQRQDGFANEIKNAYSDALKRCAMRFGVALEMWEQLIDAMGDEDYDLDHQTGEIQQPVRNAPTTQQNGPRAIQGDGNGQQRQAPPAGNEITPAQIKFIHAIASDKGIAEPDLEADCENKYGVSIGGLDRRQASAFIDLLKQYQVAEMAS
jgi:hypothetical protein